MWRSEDNCRRLYFSSIMCVLRMELRLSGLVTNTLTEPSQRPQLVFGTDSSLSGPGFAIYASRLAS